MDTINELITRLIRTYGGIREIWLVGSRANGTERPDSDWDLLIFTDEPTFQRIRRNRRLKQPHLDLLIVRDGDEFRQPWGRRPKHGFLSEWQWPLCLSERLSIEQRAGWKTKRGVDWMRGNVRRNDCGRSFEEEGGPNAINKAAIAAVNKIKLIRTSPDRCRGTKRVWSPSRHTVAQLRDKFTQHQS